MNKYLEYFRERAKSQAEKFKEPDIANIIENFIYNELLNFYQSAKNQIGDVGEEKMRIYLNEKFSKENIGKVIEEKASEKYVIYKKVKEAFEILPLFRNYVETLVEPDKKANCLKIAERLEFYKSKPLGFYPDEGMFQELTKLSQITLSIVEELKKTSVRMDQQHYNPHMMLGQVKDMKQQFMPPQPPHPRQHIPQTRSRGKKTEEQYTGPQNVPLERSKDDPLKTVKELFTAVKQECAIFYATPYSHI